MQKLNQTVLITGVLAGICAAFLTLGATAQSSFSFLLYAGSAMPIFIAGMGWGNRAAVVAIITTAIIGALVISPLFSLTIAIFTLIPAGWLSHLANLARPASELGGPDDLLARYPLSGIVLHLCLLVSVAVVILGWMIGYGPDLVARMVDLMMTSVQSREPLFEPNVEALAQTKSLLVLMLPIVQGGLWVILCLLPIISRPGWSVPSARVFAHARTFLPHCACTATPSSFFSVASSPCSSGASPRWSAQSSAAPSVRAS